ncbi:MAG TPA: stage III sporulation protein AH, partial [Verrucomicrobiae bacterium]|nr:stage III sporulation protein AH [Verrucomicrobiae bacterium]
TLLSGPKSEFGINKTESKTIQEEVPKEGQKRVQTQTNNNSQMVLAGAQANGNQPVPIIEYGPQVAGILVVAEGAKNPYVLEKIHKSVQTLLGIPANKIRVEPLGKGGN